MIKTEDIVEILRVKNNGYLYHRESQTIEFKKSYSFAALADYFRDFAAFSNNKGGYLIFGVTDSPREAVGLSNNSRDRFDDIDPERISGFLLDLFSGQIDWEQSLEEIDGKFFGVFKISQARVKPIIAKRDEGRDLKNGEIYYRYGGRTQKIRFPELEAIINKRVDQNNSQWMDLVTKIGKSGPENAAILDTERSVIEKGQSQILVIDDDLASKLTFIKEGEFNEKEGATTLQLVGDVKPIGQVEVVKRVKDNLIKRYPLSSREVASRVRDVCPDCSPNQVWRIMKETDIKNNYDYSAYNFRTKKHEDEFRETGRIRSSTASIFKNEAVDFIAEIWKQEKGH